MKIVFGFEILSAMFVASKGAAMAPDHGNDIYKIFTRPDDGGIVIQHGPTDSISAGEGQVGRIGQLTASCEQGVARVSRIEGSHRNIEIIIDDSSNINSLEFQNSRVDCDSIYINVDPSLTTRFLGGSVFNCKVHIVRAGVVDMDGPEINDDISVKAAPDTQIRVNSGTFKGHVYIENVKSVEFHSYSNKLTFSKNLLCSATERVSIGVSVDVEENWTVEAPIIQLVPIHTTGFGSILLNVKAHMALKAQNEIIISKLFSVSINARRLAISSQKIDGHFSTIRVQHDMDIRGIAPEKLQSELHVADRPVVKTDGLTIQTGFYY